VEETATKRGKCEKGGVVGSCMVLLTQKGGWVFQGEDGGVYKENLAPNG